MNSHFNKKCLGILRQYTAAPVNNYFSPIRFFNSCYQIQGRCFSCPISPDYTKGFPLFHFQGKVLDYVCFVFIVLEPSFRQLYSKPLILSLFWVWFYMPLSIAFRI